MKQYFIYILASQCNGTLYIGSTSHLTQRIWQHKNRIFRGFTSRYDVHQFVYYQEYQTLDEMIHREKQLKSWCRKWKLNLINHSNPTWRDLYEELDI